MILEVVSYSMFVNGITTSYLIAGRLSAGMIILIIPLLLGITLTINRKNSEKIEIEEDASTGTKKRSSCYKKKLRYKNMSTKNKILYIVMLSVVIAFVILLLIDHIKGVNIRGLHIQLTSILLVVRANNFQKINRRDDKFWASVIFGVLLFVLSSLTLYIEPWVLIVTGIIFIVVTVLTICD